MTQVNALAPDPVHDMRKLAVIRAARGGRGEVAFRLCNRGCGLDLQDRWRWPAYAIIAACFFVQAAFVWLDLGPNPGSTVPMSTLALEGQSLFRTHGCQSCHALYGMGGFLGPDLTNAAGRVPPARFAALLQTGAGAMPAYHLDSHARAALLAYMEAVDATGQGTPAQPAADSGPIFAAGLQRWRARGGAVPKNVAAGAQVVADGSCGGCHQSFAVDPVLRAPDLSLTLAHLEEADVRQVLASGRGAMPPQGMDARQTEQVLAFLRWLSAHRDDLAPRRSLSVATLPWFAYPSSSVDGADDSGLRQ